MRPAVPSESSCPNYENLSTFLSNQDYRKLYNKTLSICKKFHNFRSKNWFLEQCLVENLVPSTFKIKNKSQNKETSFVGTV